MKKRLTIGVISAECYRSYISETMRGIIEQSFLCGCNVVFLTALNNFQKPVHEQKRGEAQLFSFIGCGGFDGFIYDRNYFYNDEIKKRLDKMLRKTGKPVMLLDSTDSRYFENTVSHDYDCFARIAEHLITVHGYKRIYCLTGTKGVPQAEERLQAYLDTMKKHGLKADQGTYSYGDFWKRSAAELAMKILSSELHRPEAVMCASDIMAKALIEALRVGGLRVPEDIAVTGYDGYNAYCGGSVITTHRKSNRQLGSDAMRRLYSIMTGRTCKRAVDRQDRLFIGNTCGCTPINQNGLNKDRPEKLGEIYRERMLHDDMLYDMLKADSVDEILQTVDSSIYQVYGWHRFDILLTAEYLGGGEGISAFGKDTLLENMLHCDRSGGRFPTAKSFAASRLTEYLSSEKYPTAYYLTLLNFGESIMGLAALSFGKRALCYDSLYLSFIGNIRLALGELTARHAAEDRIPQQSGSELTAELNKLRERMRADPEQHWSVGDLSEQMHISRSYLHRIYRSLFGKSIIEELIGFRIAKARRLLSESNMSAADVAEQCGYSNYNHFVRQFKESEGITPSQYRKSK